MHRIISAPRFPGGRLLMCWSLLLLLGVQAKAQAQPPKMNDGPMVGILEIQRDTTKRVQMSTKLKISQVQNENPKIARVQTLLDDPTSILITGLNPGSTRVTLTDEQKNIESLDVRVPEDAEIQFQKNRKRFLDHVRATVPAAVVDVSQPGPGTVIVTGTVDNAEKVHTILAIAGGVFGVGPAGAAGGTGVINGITIGGVQQVELSVVVAVVNRSEARNLAINFFENRPDWFLNSFLTAPLSVASTLATGIAGGSATALATGGANGSATPNLSFGILSQSSGFNGYIQALRTESLIKILAEPRLVTLSGRPAQIVSGGQIQAIVGGTGTGGGGGGSISTTFGTVVNFVPIVLGDGKIHLEVTPSLSDVPVTTTQAATVVIQNNRRSAQVAVRMEDGQTLAIGGLIQRNVNGTVNKVPVLGDLPFLGTFFSTKSYQETEEEMLILVTPRLVDPMACTQLPKYLPGRETRAPDDFELFLEGIMEAPRGQRDVFPGCHYLPVHRSPGANALFPCGDYPHPGCGLRGRHGSCFSGTCASGTCASGTCTTGNCSTGNCSTGGCSNGSCGGSVSSIRLPAQSSDIVPTGAYEAEAPRGLDVYTQPMPSSSSSNDVNSALPGNIVPASGLSAEVVPASADIAPVAIPQGSIPPASVPQGSVPPGYVPPASVVPTDFVPTVTPQSNVAPAPLPPVSSTPPLPPQGVDSSLPVPVLGPAR